MTLRNHSLRQGALALAFLLMVGSLSPVRAVDASPATCTSFSVLPESYFPYGPAGGIVLANWGSGNNLDLIYSDATDYPGISQWGWGGDGTGQFREDIGYLYPTFNMPTGGARAICALDINLDGSLDVITAWNNGGLFVAFVDGREDAAAIEPSRLDYWPEIVSQFAVGDFDNDGHDDVVGCRLAQSNNLLVILANTCDRCSPSWTPATFGSTPHGIAAADFDEDGNLDIAIADSSASAVIVGQGDGAGGFQAGTSTPIEPLPLRSVSTGDFDGDANSDVFVVYDAPSAPYGSLLLGDGAGHFSPAVRVQLGGSQGEVVAADFTGDGCTDLAASHPTTNTIGVVLSAGDGTFADPVLYGVGTAPGPVAAGDVNNDGRIDIVVGSTVSSSFSVLLNRVVYDFGGFEQPINADGSSVFRAGSTVPVKCRLTDCAGAPVTTAINHLYVARVSNGVAGTEQEAVSTNAPDSGNTFRAVGNGEYHFNWGTRGLAQGTWQVRAELDDGTSQTVLVSLAAR